ncbi:MAG: hypothetical protein HQM08_22880 [Candidatus Riflebacteria bacterium]|nr:hypothetical protein [Candidatus Riflebacteria bacterium]
MSVKYLARNLNLYNWIGQGIANESGCANCDFYRPICPPGWGQLGALITPKCGPPAWPSVLVKLDSDLVK